MLEPNRWLAYRRLQELGIHCMCQGGQPLVVDVRTPTQAVQVWSVGVQLSWHRTEAINWLQKCWQLPYPQT